MRIRAKVFNKNKIEGYLIGDTFVSRNKILNYRDRLDATKVLSNGLVRTNYAVENIALSQLQNFKDSFNRVNGFKRNVTSKFQDWYDNDRDLILFVRGARQVGKTFEVKRFAQSHFKNVYYLNLGVDESFIQRLLNRGARSVYEATIGYFKFRGIAFEDTAESVLILDEIQVSIGVYNLLREFRNKFKCAVIVTGSYLGFLVNRKSFHPAGDLHEVEMTPLTFKEFCIANDTPYCMCDKTKELYDVYRQIGGFPRVVKVYQKSHDISKCLEQLRYLWSIFCDESDTYIKDIPCEEAFNECMRRVIIQLATEKTGLKDLMYSKEELEERTVQLMTEEIGSMSIVSNKVLQQSLEWLHRSGVIGICRMHKDGNVRGIDTDKRIYIRDVGLANFLMRRVGRRSSDREGVLTECFAYNELRNLLLNKPVDIDLGCLFYQGYELDFAFCDYSGDYVLGIEVKTTNSSAKSLKFFRSKRLIDIPIKAGLVPYQVQKNVINYPIYLIGELDINSLISDYKKL